MSSASELQTSIGANGNNDEKKTSPEAIRESIVVEMRSPIMTNIHERLSRTEKELMRTVEENKNLKELMEQLNKDLMELHADLFQEANRQVTEAQCLQQRAEKRATEIKHENDVLRSEVEALKSMILTSTPSLPNKRLHPQLDANHQGSTQHKSASISKVLKGFEGLMSSRKAGIKSCVTDPRQTFLRSTSHHEITKELQQAIDNPTPTDETDSCSQVAHVDPLIFQLFRDWVKVNSPLPNRHSPFQTESTNHNESQNSSSSLMQPPTTSSQSVFLEKVFEDDIQPCLDFSSAPSELTQRLSVALRSLLVEIDPCSSGEKGSQPCVLIPGKLCSYRFKFKASHRDDSNGDGPRDSLSSECFHICNLARNRLVAVCNFYNYLSLISKGLLKCALIEEQFRNVQTLRKDMSLARLGFDLP